MSSNRHRVCLALALSAVVACARAAPAAAAQGAAAVAVFPVENLSGGPIPESEIRQFLIDALESASVQVLDEAALEQFFERHRVRYTGGIDEPTAEALRSETGVRRVLIAAVEQSGTGVPPKIAMFARLVSVDGSPMVVWADDVAMSGDERPGWLDLGLINDYQSLQRRALERLSTSLRAFVKSGLPPAVRADRKFRPDAIYRPLVLENGRVYSVAVMPFVNLTGRTGAGDILALLFMQHLSAFQQFKVLDAGIVRSQLLAARIIVDGGVSLSDADTVGALVDADFILGGRVLRYDGSSGSTSMVRVEFSTVLIERRSRKVVWSSDSHNDGREDVGFFERGASRTAHVMATQMVRLTAASMAGRGR